MNLSKVISSDVMEMLRAEKLLVKFHESRAKKITMAVSVALAIWGGPAGIVPFCLLQGVRAGLGSLDNPFARATEKGMSLVQFALSPWPAIASRGAEEFSGLVIDNSHYILGREFALKAKPYVAAASGFAGGRLGASFAQILPKPLQNFRNAKDAIVNIWDGRIFHPLQQLL
ncbi:hypothetical protein DID80_07070 [Candidatus Marinamargulisbacteria bacterium SCGC AAA071-K20]|nr:hypothetical protein DID80_07070 [Candidatus Marinamargulisbacteria bacterium SCGC AAA071-K20]